MNKNNDMQESGMSESEEDGEYNPYGEKFEDLEDEDLNCEGLVNDLHELDGPQYELDLEGYLQNRHKLG